MIKKIFKMVLLLDLIAVISCGLIYVSPSMQRCHEAPLAMGLHVTWFGPTLQFNHGFHEIISNVDGDEPWEDSWVKGTVQYKSITAYGITDYQDGVFFKALDWNGRERTFLLQDYPYEDDTGYGMEIVEQTGSVPVDVWAKVDKRTCLIGIFPAVPILVAGITLMLLMILTLWFIGTIPSRIRRRLK
ncbi:MAG: hypothetical protein ABF335_11940 [Alphaproteobacteria bacterium]